MLRRFLLQPEKTVMRRKKGSRRSICSSRRLPGKESNRPVRTVKARPEMRRFPDRQSVLKVTQVSETVRRISGILTVRYRTAGRKREIRLTSRQKKTRQDQRERIQAGRRIRAMTLPRIQEIPKKVSQKRMVRRKACLTIRWKKRNFLRRQSRKSE
jgi:hypothetical protein